MSTWYCSATWTGRLATRHNPFCDDVLTTCNSTWLVIIMDDLKCGICLELFQDPRSLPCLHTFCRDCLQRSLNEENHSLKCPVCRAKHELSERAELLPVNQYALQELPLKRLQQQREDNGGPHQLVECKSCGEQAGPVVAWCEDCDAMICQQCSSQHEKMSILRGHVIKPVKKFRQGSSESTAEGNGSESTDLPPDQKLNTFSKCLRHENERLKYLCISCSELVCSDCLLLGSHAGHHKELLDGARPSLETKMGQLVAVTGHKKQEFSEYLERVKRAEGKALDYKELMETKVNVLFDGIVASVEAQRNEALQSVSKEVKEIWSQKEMMEVSLAQLDSFTKFAENTHKCKTDTSYVAMAAQGVKLMERLKYTHGNDSALNQKIHIGSHFHDEDPHLPQLFSFGLPSLEFSPAPGTELPNLIHGFRNMYSIDVTLVAGGQPVLFPSIPIDNCSLKVIVVYRGRQWRPDVRQKDQSSWSICLKFTCSEETALPLALKCQVTGAVSIKTNITYDT